MSKKTNISSLIFLREVLVMGILDFKNKQLNKTYLAVSILGKIFKINILYTNSSTVNLNKKETEIDLFLPKAYKNHNNTEIINMAIKKLYSEIANTKIEYSMEIARHILHFAPEDYIIKELPNDFYKCKNNIITISPDIIQYNEEIINTTILQAFCRIKYKYNSNAYKKALTLALLKYDEFKLNGLISKSLEKSA